MPEHVNPVVSEILPLAEIIELRCEYRLYVFLIRRDNNSLACNGSLGCVRTLTTFAQTHESIVPEFKSLIAGHSAAEINKE